MLSYIWATTSGQARCPGYSWVMNELKIGSKTTMVDWPHYSKYIRPGITIYSDMWAAYSGLGNPRPSAYVHGVVNHSRNFVDPVSGVCTNGVESMWSRAKSKFKAMNGTSRVLIAQYLFEYMWAQRFPDQKFASFWKCVSEMGRYTFGQDEDVAILEVEEVGDEDVLPGDLF